jgi:hypothetical protein
MLHCVWKIEPGSLSCTGYNVHWVFCIMNLLCVGLHCIKSMEWHCNALHAWWWKRRLSVMECAPVSRPVTVLLWLQNTQLIHVSHQLMPSWCNQTQIPRYPDLMAIKPVNPGLEKPSEFEFAHPSNNRHKQTQTETAHWLLQVSVVKTSIHQHTIQALLAVRLQTSSIGIFTCINPITVDVYWFRQIVNGSLEVFKTYTTGYVSSVTTSVHFNIARLFMVTERTVEHAIKWFKNLSLWWWLSWLSSSTHVTCHMESHYLITLQLLLKLLV